jgi:hypothetical protein
MGDRASDPWAHRVAKTPYANAVLIEQRLEAQGVAEEEDSRSFLGRLWHASPNATCMWFMVAGTALVLITSAMRLRFTWWRLYPLMFVTWASTPMRLMWFSFFVGWLVKGAVVRYGGHATYNRLKPLMLGMIVGEMLGAIVPNLIGAIQYLITGEQPMVYQILHA